MLGHRRLNFFRYFVSNDLNINYLLCNLNRYVVDLHPIGRILSFPNNICRVLRGERQRLQ